VKGCARSCILLLLGWAAAAYGFYRYFVSLHDFGPPMYWGSAAAGLFVVAAIGYAVGIGTAHRERKMLLEAMAGTQPADGRWAAVSGTIQSLSPLTAPLSRQKVVAYEYKIHRSEQLGKSRSDITYYDGRAVAPSTIATRHGSVRLLCVPSFHEIEAESFTWSEALERAKDYVAGTAFTVFDTEKKRRQRLEEEWTDDDGQYRVDRQHYTREVDLADGFQFEEKHIKQGDQVCAFGLYSQQRAGLIPHSNWAKQTRVVRGDASKVADQLKRRMIRYCFGVVIFSALVYGIVRLYQFKVGVL
jgi:hypothetical protein